MKANENKIAFICFHFLFRIELFQRVMRKKVKEFGPASTRLAGCAQRSPASLFLLSVGSPAARQPGAARILPVEMYITIFCFVQVIASTKLPVAETQSPGPGFDPWRALEGQLAGETPTRIPPEHAQRPLAAKATRTQVESTGFEPMDRRTGWGGAIRPSAEVAARPPNRQQSANGSLNSIEFLSPFAVI
jgi:hypothetical protein